MFTNMTVWLQSIAILVAKGLRNTVFEHGELKESIVCPNDCDVDGPQQELPT